MEGSLSCWFRERQAGYLDPSQLLFWHDKNSESRKCYLEDERGGEQLTRVYFLLIVVNNEFRECRLEEVIIKRTIWQQFLQNLLKQVKNEIIFHACEEQIYHNGNHASLIFVTLIRENFTFQQLSKIVPFPRPPLFIEQVSISGHTPQGNQYLIQHFLLPLDRVHMKMPEKVESNVWRGDDSVGVEEIAQLLVVI